MLVKAAVDAEMSQALGGGLSELAAPEGVTLVADVDPVSML